MHMLVFVLSSRCLTALTATLAVLLVTAGAALAADSVYFEGSTSTDGVFGPRHSLTKNSARSLDGSWICVSAANVDGSWAGSPNCDNDLAVHTYCGCSLRFPWAGSAFSWSALRARLYY